MKKALIASIIVAIAIAGFLLDLLQDAGQFKHIRAYGPGACQKVTGVVGAEDITIHPQSGVAFISCDDRRATLRGEKTQGAIYAYDLTSENPTLSNLTQHFPKDFHPHGISLYLGENGQARLFVVNHTHQGMHFIEIFDYVDDQLIHRESIAGELLHSPNDVAAVGPRSFYVTNDHGYRSRLGRKLEEYLRLAKANVLYYDGSAFKIAARGISYANGINVSSDGKTVFVAATTSGKIRAYSRNENSGKLAWKYDIPLNTGVDNIEIDRAGNLWVAAHPKLLTFVKHAKDPQQKSPSQVLKVELSGDHEFQIQKVFLDSGNKISGSSVGTVFEQKLLIGSVFEKHFLVCQLQ
ncbi:MAG: strictosidine synthase family protein [bacterium]